MKNILSVFFLIVGLYISSCKNNDTNTQMPNGGYKERSDSGTSMPSSPDTKDRGAVAVDTIKNGQAVISGATTSDSTKK